MSIGSARAVREALLRFAKCVERLIVFVMNQMQVGSGEQRLLEPWTCRSGLAQFIDRAIKGVVVAGGEVDLTQQIQAMRVDFAAFATDQGEDQLGVTVFAAAMKRVRQGKLYR